jgi:hypothetical protein
MVSPTIAQEEPTSPRFPATPSHGRLENRAEEHAGYEIPTIRAWPPRPAPKGVHGYDEHSTNQGTAGGEQNER